MGRHAYLIMAHNEFGLLGRLLELLDYEENDIYLHIDKKVKDFPQNEISAKVKKSGLFYLPSVEVNWGGYSQIACEMGIFRYMIRQVREKYQYYHLLSGVDLPLKSQEEIHAFFDNHDGQEFVNMEPYDPNEKQYIYRVKYYYPFQEKIGAARPKGKNPLFYRILAAGCFYVQKMLHVNRCKGKKIRKGANWIDVTWPCLEYIVSREEDIYRQYRMTLCGDELFLQNILLDSPFQDKIYTEPLRYIDWKRGNPYVFRKEDFQELMDSGYLWARKFDTRKDKEIVALIADALRKKKE